MKIQLPVSASVRWIVGSLLLSLCVLPVGASSKGDCNTTKCPKGYVCLEQLSKCPEQYSCGKEAVCIKVGNCPPLPLPEFIHHQEPIHTPPTCSQDSDCKGQLKCCYTGSNGGFYCIAPQLPIPSPPTSCAALLCEVGEVCVLKPVNGCQQPVCATCVRPKPGNCKNPAILNKEVLPTQLCFWPPRCYSDDDCPGNQKCCPNRYGCAECQTPADFITPCPVKCPVGYVCRKVPVYCFVPPCPEQYQCVRINFIPNGACPVLRSRVIPAFDQHLCKSHDNLSCKSDRECKAGQKCCPGPCGRYCVNVQLLD